MESERERERWMTLCAQAAVEPDPKRLLALISEVNDLLEQREKKISHPRALERRDAEGSRPPE